MKKLLLFFFLFSLIIHFSVAQVSFDSVWVWSGENAPGQLTTSLDPETWYFIHLRAENEYGGGVFSSNKYFKTGLVSGLYDKLDPESIVLFPTALSSGEFIIRLKLEDSREINICIYDAIGRGIFNMEDKSVETGQKDIRISSELLNGPGLYYVRVKVGERFTVKPLVILE